MVKVFIIDDSLMVRNALVKVLKDDENIEIIGEANNPVDAFATFKKVGLPDVFILDIEMPKMDGLSFLKQINAQKPIPVIICSTLVTNGSTAAIDALRLGAFDIVEKPKINLKEFFSEYKNDLKAKIFAAANAKKAVGKNSSSDMADSDKKVDKSNIMDRKSEKIVAIGSSTGGVQVIEEIAKHLIPNHKGIVVTQHMPEGFTKSFADRLDNILPNSKVYEAKDGDVVKDASIYIAPGGLHMKIKKNQNCFIIVIEDFQRVNSHKPSVNVLLTSVAEEAKDRALGFVLTGMGDDGALGLLKMRESGAQTFVQNEKTATVFGMPRVALEMGGAIKDLSIFEITKKINDL